jgi:hypothetical protein
MLRHRLAGLYRRAAHRPVHRVRVRGGRLPGAGWLAAGWVPACLLLVLIPSQRAYGVDVADIIKNAAAHEQRYKDLDVILRSAYEDFQPHEPQPDFHVILESHLRIRCVSQQGMLHLEVRGTAKRDSRTSQAVPRDRIHLFDGTTSRLLEGGRANIVEGPRDDEFVVRPHMLILHNTVPVPLSTYLRGNGAAVASAQISVRTQYRGQEAVQGHVCEKVSIQNVINETGNPHSAWVLWLATDRNYLPLRCDAYTYHVSKTVPVGEAVSRDLREIAPGVWFPYETVYTAYNSITLGEQKRQELGWRERFTVESVSLNPHYPVAFFRDLDIPKGTRVYHVDADGKIGRSYVKGDADTDR